MSREKTYEVAKRFWVDVEIDTTKQHVDVIFLIVKRRE